MGSIHTLFFAHKDLVRRKWQLVMASELGNSTSVLRCDLGLFS